MREDGPKKLYSLSHAGRDEVAQKSEQIKAVWEELTKARASLEISRPGEPSEQWRPDVLEEAIRDLKAALFDTLASSSQEKERVVQIMRRAIADIRSK